MKLPSGQNSPQPSSVKPSQQLTVEKSSAQAAQILARLNNTWVKVEKSEPLNQAQSQQALSKSALNGENSPQNKTPSQSQSQPEQSRQAILNSQLKSQAAQPATRSNDTAITSQPPAQPSGETTAKQVEQLNALKAQIQALASNQNTAVKLNLLTLKHNSGSIRLLSPQNYPINSEVLIKQDAQGAWALHKPSSGFALHNFAQNHASILSKPLALFDLNQTQPPQLNLLDKLNIQLPKLSLTSTHTPNSQSIQSAINTSGQFFEQQLQQAMTQIKASTGETNKPALNVNMGNTVNTANNATPAFTSALPASIRSVFSLPISEKNGAASQPANTQGTQTPQASEGTTLKPQTVIGQNLNQKIKQVDTLINKWVAQLLPNHKTTNQHHSIQQNTNSTQPSNSTNTMATQGVSFNNKTQLTQPPTQPLQTPASNNQDMKAWLINSQQLLVKQVINNAQSPGEKSDEQKNKLQQLSSMFTLLLQPKTASSEKTTRIWPSNLSAQQQLTLLLAQQPPSMLSGQKEQDDIARLLLNISQQLNRLQGEQVNNRLHQQQNPESNQLQMSLPYLHEEQVHWCQMEWQGEKQQQLDKEQAFSWHLVLRFAQHQHNAFAIESQMMQNQLHITLWAEQQDQLKHLHQHMGILQTRLNEAGFNVSSLKSKHGMPPLKSNPISSSLVDVHT